MCCIYTGTPRHAEGSVDTFVSAVSCDLDQERRLIQVKLVRVRRNEITA